MWVMLTGELKDCTVPGPLGEVSREAESKVKSEPGAAGVAGALTGATDRLSPDDGDELETSGSVKLEFSAEPVGRPGADGLLESAAPS